MKKKLYYIICMVICLKVEAQVSTFKTVDSLTNIGRYQKALQALRELPEDFITNKKTAHIYEAIDNHKLASTYYMKSLSIKEDYTVKVKLGKTYVKLGQIGKAITVFEEIIKNDSENLLVKYELGKLYLKTNRVRKAADVFKELIKADNSNANYSYYLGLVYDKQKENNKRIDAYLDAYKKDDEHIKAIEKLAIAYRALRDKDSSNLFVEKGLQIAPYNSNLNRLKINEFYRSEKYNEAIGLLKKIDSIEPNEHYTHKMLGKCYLKINDNINAKKHFSKALTLDGEDYSSHIFLGNIYFEEKELSKSIMNYFMATMVGKEPRDEAHLGIANVFFEQKKPIRVIEHYKKAIAENGANYKALYLLANFSDNYYKDKKIAYTHYKKYIDKFEYKDAVYTQTAKERIKDIKKEFFLQGEILE